MKWFEIEERIYQKGYREGYRLAHLPEQEQKRIMEEQRREVEEERRQLREATKKALRKCSDEELQEILDKYGEDEDLKDFFQEFMRERNNS